MGLKKKFAAAALGLLLILSGCSTGTDATVYGGSFTFTSPGGKREFVYPPGERQTVGDFTGTSLLDENTTIKLSDFAGRVVVINFWGSWCAGCRAEAADLNVAAELTADDNVQFLGINIKDSRSAGADFVASKQVTFPSIFDPTMRTLLSMQGLPTTGIPITVILDKSHQVANIFLRNVSAQEVDVAATALAAENSSTASSSATR
ncbi:TlpA family protein disulfide reductase [Nakamurella antarctica]|uniref:TlpA family protein disulfide reductase n=1 Tax=Nakamurella antarctica TaxID=1902245 RepID=A0A3G8ZNP4_9ACTN|nr:TlpA disulfide reductase family protein [Nakamurella antarctica]AZI58758.1 TlpA family protein disulfide reductase [Nakamurella antarctica]